LNAIGVFLPESKWDAMNEQGKRAALWLPEDRAMGLVTIFTGVGLTGGGKGTGDFRVVFPAKYA